MFRRRRTITNCSPKSRNPTPQPCGRRKPRMWMLPHLLADSSLARVASIRIHSSLCLDPTSPVSHLPISPFAENPFPADSATVRNHGQCHPGEGQRRPARNITWSTEAQRLTGAHLRPRPNRTTCNGRSRPSINPIPFDTQAITHPPAAQAISVISSPIGMSQPKFTRPVSLSRKPLVILPVAIPLAAVGEALTTNHLSPKLTRPRWVIFPWKKRVTPQLLCDNSNWRIVRHSVALTLCLHPLTSLSPTRPCPTHDSA